MEPNGKSRLSRGELVDRYFIENRTRVLELAAFLDRLDRAGAGGDDFRMRALRKAIRTLSEREAGRIHRVQMQLSDESDALLEELDQKSADGAPRQCVEAE